MKSFDFSRYSTDKICFVTENSSADNLNLNFQTQRELITIYKHEWKFPYCARTLINLFRVYFVGALSIFEFFNDP